MSPTAKYADAKKAYLVSLRHKLAKSYQQECDAKATMDRRWVNGFMATFIKALQKRIPQDAM